MHKCFLHALAMRRSIYGFDNKIALSDSELRENLAEVIKNVPSAYNAQSARVVLLLNEQHQKLWQIVLESLYPLVPPEKRAATESKIKESFAAGYGTILFFEDAKALESAQNKFPLYKDNFGIWAEQANGMLQYAVWTMLAAAGIGASLQHYNPLIDEKVKQTWNLPEFWQLKAQMPFGEVKTPPADKTFISVAERFKVFA
jgi:uncharacterized protein